MIAQSVDAPPRTSRAPVIYPVLAWAALVLLTVLSITELRSPAPVTAAAPPTEFSAERAQAHVFAISRAPHPIGTSANAAVREYLVAQLAGLGLNPQVVEALGVAAGRRIVIGNTRDIVGRLPGTANSKAVMLVAHYDSVGTGPGAADDGASVAAILEAVRALRAGPALKNDLIVLFTDGEEDGLLGAEAFAHSHPWFKDAGVVLNFEARGNRGPSLLFETSAGNSSLIQAVSEAAPHPIGSSLFYSLYKMLPNDTDFTVFSGQGASGLNFALGENLEAYHTRLDSAENLSPGSLQHHGSYALSLGRYFGQQDLTHLKSGRDDIFFNLLGSSFFVYGQNLVLPAEIIVTVLLLGVIVFGIRRSEFRWSRVLLGLLPSLALLLAIPVALGAVAWLYVQVFSARMIVSDSAANTWLLAGFALLGLCAGVALLAVFARRFTVAELTLSGLVLICALSWALALALPGGSYLLFQPLLLMTLGILAITLLKRFTPRAFAVAGLAGTALTVMLLAPLVWLVYVFFTMQWITAAIVGLLIGLFFVLCTPFLTMALPESGSRPVVFLLLACGLVSLGAGTLLSHPGPEHPRHDTIFYSQNADEHKAAWITFDRAVDDWTSQFFANQSPTPQAMPDYLAGFRRPVLSAPATDLHLASPVADIKADEKTGTLHRIRMNVRSTRNANVLRISFGDKVRLVSVKIGAREVVAGRNFGSSLQLLGMDANGVDLDLTLDAPSGVSFWLEDESLGLPDGSHPRTANFSAGQGSDAMLVCRKYSL